MTTQLYYLSPFWRLKVTQSVTERFIADGPFCKHNIDFIVKQERCTTAKHVFSMFGSRVAFNISFEFFFFIYSKLTLWRFVYKKSEETVVSLAHASAHRQQIQSRLSTVSCSFCLNKSGHVILWKSKKQQAQDFLCMEQNAQRWQHSHRRAVQPHIRKC